MCAEWHPAIDIGTCPNKMCTVLDALMWTCDKRQTLQWHRIPIRTRAMKVVQWTTCQFRKASQNSCIDRCVNMYPSGWVCTMADVSSSTSFEIFVHWQSWKLSRAIHTGTIIQVTIWPRVKHYSCCFAHVTFNTCEKTFRTASHVANFSRRNRIVKQCDSC